MKRKLALLSALGLVLVSFAACNGWERQTYQSLATAKAVIDQAGLDYNAGTIAQTAVNRALIERARAAQTAATQAFELYAVMKVSKQATSLAQQQQLVAQAVAEIPPLIEAIRELYTKSGGGGAR